MILKWQDLVDFYGSAVEAHRDALNSNKPTTYALLCCSPFADQGALVKNTSGDHAESRLLASDLWTDRVPQAMEFAGGDKPVLFTLALNRAPCGHCARLLANALSELQFQYAARFEHTYFILAARGNYHSYKKFEEAREKAASESSSGQIRDQDGNFPEDVQKTISTGHGMDLLTKSGWLLCGLQFGDQLSRSGEELARFLTQSSVAIKFFIINEL